MALSRLMSSPVRQRLLLYGTLGGMVWLAVTAPSEEETTVVAPVVRPARALARIKSAPAPDVPGLVSLVDHAAVARWPTRVFSPAPAPTPILPALPAATPAPIVTPQAALPWKWIGRIDRGGERMYFFNRQQETITLHVGEELPGGYRLVAVDEGRATLALPSGESRQLLLTSTGGQP